MPHAEALTKDNPKRKLRDRTITEDRLAGATYRQLAKKHNLSYPYIGTVLKQSEMKDILETGAQQMITLVPKALDNYRLLLDSDDQNIKLKASQDVCKTTGIAPTHAQSVYIERLTLNQQVNYLAPEITATIARYVASGDDDVVVITALGL